MAATDLVLELLDDVSPHAYCDDCLSLELGITPRQTVNQICRTLSSGGRLKRLRTTCHRCGKVKLANSRADSATALGSAGTSTAASRLAKAASQSQDIDIEKLRTQVVRICVQLWQSTQSAPRPHSVSVMINALRNGGALPSHQANMMLTLCNLRNVYTYEGMPLGESESAIAANASKIVFDWWAGREGRSRNEI